MFGARRSFYESCVMEVNCIKLQPDPVIVSSYPSLSMNSIASIRFSPLRCLCTRSNLKTAPQPKITRTSSGSIPKKSTTKDKVSESALREKWLDSLSYPVSVASDTVELGANGSSSEWIIGVDPDVSGALALLKSDHSGFSAQVSFDSCFPVLISSMIYFFWGCQTGNVIAMMYFVNVFFFFFCHGVFCKC